MSACEKCWGDAWLRSQTTGKSQADCYRELLRERDDNPCSPKEQAGEWWDEDRRYDSRFEGNAIHRTSISKGRKKKYR